MATETDVIEVQFRAVGNAAVAAAFEQMSAASAKTDAKILQFDRSSKQAADSTAKLSESAKRAKDFVERYGDSAGRASESTKKLASSAKTTEGSFGGLNAGMSKGAFAVGVFARAASDAAPGLGKLAQTASLTASTITSFGAYLGGGPWGVAIGVAVAAVGLLSHAFGDAKEDAETLQEAIAKIGTGRTDVQNARLASKQARDEDTRRRAMNAPGGFFDSVVGGGPRTAAQEAAQAQAYSDDYDRNLKAYGDVGEGKAGGKPSKLPDAEFAIMQRRAENERRIRALDAKAGGPSQADALQTQIDAPELAAEKTRTKLAAEFDAENEHQERLVELRTDSADVYAKLDAEAIAREEQKRAIASAAVTSVAAVSLDAFQKMAKGQKMSAKEFMGSIGDSIAAVGKGHILQGLAMAFIPLQQPMAGGLVAAGAAEYAFGVGLGAAMSGGGGGGGGHSTRGKAGVDYAAPRESGGDYLDRTRASSPSSRSGGGGGGGGTTVVNVTMPTVISPTADDAVRIKQALREGERAGV